MKQTLSVVILAALPCLFCGLVCAQDKPAGVKPATAASKPDATPAGGKEASGIKFLPPGDGKPDAGKTQPAATRGLLKFLPPGDGKPVAGRIEGGASRGDVRELAMSVLAPKGTGLASSTRPDLYWFVSRPVIGEVVLTIMQADGKAIDPHFEGKLALPKAAGIQRVSLASLGVALKPAVDYDWSISIVSPGQPHSSDVLASGQIRVAALDPKVAGELAALDAYARVVRLAASGYWYDVVTLVREQKAASAEEEVALYESAGLSRVVRYLREGV